MPELATAALGLFKAGAGAVSSMIGGSASGLLGASQFASGLKLLTGIGAGLAQAGNMKAQADEADLQSGQESVQQAQKAAAAKRQLMGVLGDNRATFAAAGIDISQGIAADNEATNKRQTADQLNIDRRDTEFKQALLKQRSRNLRRGANMAVFSSIASGLGDFAGGMAGANSLNIKSAAAKPDSWASLRSVG